MPPDTAQVIKVHPVDRLPHGQSIALRLDDEGHVDYYISREHTIDRISHDLALVTSAAVQDHLDLRLRDILIA